MLSRKPPFADLLASQPLEAVLRAAASRDLRPPFPSDAPAPLRDLASECWVRKPEKRPSAAAVQEAVEAFVERLGEEMETADRLRQERQQHKEVVGALVVDLLQATEEGAVAETAAEALTQLLPGAGVVAVGSLTCEEIADVLGERPEERKRGALAGASGDTAKKRAGSLSEIRRAY